MNTYNPAFQITVAKTPADLHAAQRLRYDVFVTELGGDGPLVDHDARRECDRFDPHAIHLLLRDNTRADPAQVVGVYRLLTQDGARAAGQFYCEDEYDLTPLHQSGKRLLELGRSCLHPAYRGGAAMLQMWSALAQLVTREKIDLLFGVASFPGTDLDALAAPLSILHARHLAPEDLRVRAKGPTATAMDLIDTDRIDTVSAMRDTPALIKAYLRLGGCVGDGAFVDHDFNTTDICMIVEAAKINTLQRTIYQRGQGLDG